MLALILFDSKLVDEKCSTFCFIEFCVYVGESIRFATLRSSIFVFCESVFIEAINLSLSNVI